MKNNILNTQTSPKTYFIGMLLFAVSTLTACNSNNHGDTTSSHDTSSTVTNRVDTEANSTGTKQP